MFSCIFVGKTMESELEDRAAAYDGMRQLKIAKNLERLKSLPHFVDKGTASHQSKPVEKPRKKVMYTFMTSLKWW
jgi:hypothetical protein